MDCNEFNITEAIDLFIMAADMDELLADKPRDPTSREYASRGANVVMMERAREYYEHARNCTSHRYEIIDRLVHDAHKYREEDMDMALQGWLRLRVEARKS